MKESHYTALLGAAVFGFSIVTIIFTPMSFVLALLAVPDDSLLVAPVKEERKRHFVGKWTGKSGLASSRTLLMLSRDHGGYLNWLHGSCHVPRLAALQH